MTFTNPFKVCFSSLLRSHSGAPSARQAPMSGRGSRVAVQETSVLVAELFLCVCVCEINLH